MQDKLIHWIGLTWDALHNNTYWMAWNLFLAFIPLALSVWLFRQRVKPKRANSTAVTLKAFPTPVWWLGLLVFIVFLPNAPYVLTDVIHLIHDIRRINSVWLITLVLIPQYILFIFAGFEAYVISLINLGYFLHRQGWARSIWGTELVIHGLSAIGIYLGRFLRFNSWDLVTQPDSLVGSVLEDVLGKRPLVVIVVTFMVITGLYWLLKGVTLAIAAYWKPSRNVSA